MSKEVPKAAIFHSVMLTRPRCHQANELEPIAMQCPSPTSRESNVPTVMLAVNKKAVGALWTMLKEVPKATIFHFVMLTRPRCSPANELEPIKMQCPSPTSRRTGAQKRGQIARHANWLKCLPAS